MAAAEGAPGLGLHTASGPLPPSQGSALRAARQRRHTSGHSHDNYVRVADDKFFVPPLERASTITLASLAALRTSESQGRGDDEEARHARRKPPVPLTP